jgi:predicted LPLAT superfamily acyltransferase
VQILKHIHHFSAVILDRVYFISNQTEQFDVKIFNEELILDLIKKKYKVIGYNQSLAKLREILRASQQIECKANGLLLSLFALQLESFI